MYLYLVPLMYSMLVYSIPDLSSKIETFCFTFYFNVLLCQQEMRFN